MGITVTTTSGESPRFDIFDNGLALLALHSACLALAFAAMDKAAPVAAAFNLTWMAAGFAFGAVLAVLAAYYGTINAKALGPQLIGQPQPDAFTLEVREEPAASENAPENPEESDEASLATPSWLRQPVSRPMSPELRSRLIVTAVVLVMFLLVGAAINRVADMVDERHVAAATKEAEEPPRAKRAGKADAGAANAPAEVADTAEAKSARVKTAREGADTDNRARRWRAWMIIGLAGLVLLPLPFAWSGPSQFLSAARGFLVLGSLLSFVLGVGVALLPLAANSVEEGINQAISEDQGLPGAGRPGVTERRGSDNAPARIETGGQRPTDGAGESPADGPPAGEPTVTPDDIARLESRIGDLQGAFANATAARDVRVTMTDPRPAAQIDVHPAPVKVVPPKLVDQPVVGEQGPQGEPGLVRRCDLQARWPVIACRWTTAPDVESPAPLPPF